ncbi:MAG: sodium:alanine symporter family protein [Candidatus Omnitrophica bacterium]|nr:sodium:alanine symporter family protein [Candidatus Omnitrophota bacterium]MCM8794073.1 sodium:alanine symporter family protein [Candidatus Omnitrophota bacterium]
MDLLIELNSKINRIIWGPFLLFLLIGIGLYYSIGTGFIQFKKFKRMLKEVFRKRKNELEGDITPLQAVSVALAGTVGVGNIAGVATAVSLGGPGAIFWMWISGFLGMATKYAEVVLGIKYRIRQIRGPLLGGPMVYIRRGLGKKFNFLAITFALLGALAAFGIGNMTQANSVAIGLSEFGISRFFTGLLLILSVGLVTIGGLKRIAQVAIFCVPFMCILYFLGAMVIILLNFSHLPQVFGLIFKGAFTPLAASGGFLGAGVKQAVRWGMARGVFSNEAGLGSAPIAHATAKTDHPVRQGFYGIFEVFIDTIVICSATALAILVTDVWKTGSTGAILTMLAFQNVFGKVFGFSLVVFSMVLTAYDTILAWGFYGETCSAYLFGPKARNIYRLLWLPPILIGAMGKLEIIWNLADTLNGLMAIPNLIALFLLGKVVFNLTKEFFKNYT